MARKRPRKPAPPLPPPRESARLYARMAPRHIAMFRFLLEAQDNLGYMTVLDRGIGGGAGGGGTVGAAGCVDDEIDADTNGTASGTGADAALKVVFSPHQEREMRAFLESMRAAIPFEIFESPLRAQAG
ncbi:DUF4911 domain-containing protein [Nitratidesulfovibrio sp. D1]|uniref:DUF4911 domain-containing protein n=1 Tax=Nitratidesulfovibrio sp. D1 TaxID=3440151 RepID=UPI003EBC1E47